MVRQWRGQVFQSILTAARVVVIFNEAMKAAGGIQRHRIAKIERPQAAVGTLKEEENHEKRKEELTAATIARRAVDTGKERIIGRG